MTADYHNNTTSTFSETEEDLDESFTAGDIILVICAQLLSLFIICVNSITIIVIRKTPSLHTLSNIYVTSLAASDLVVGLCLIPLSLFYVPSVKQHHFDQNVKLCVLVLGINLGMAVVSTLHMTLIAIDRYAYIIQPYIYQKVVDRKFISLVLCGTWAFGLLYSMLPQLIHNDPSLVPKCDITLAMPIEYLFYTTFSLYTVCVIIDVTMYTQILYVAYKQRRLIQSTACAADIKPLDMVSVITVTETPHSRDTRPSSNNVGALTNLNSLQATNDTHSDDLRRSSLARRKITSRMKSVKFFFTVFGVYFVCLTPTVVCMGVDYYRTIPRFLYNMFNLLALLNSGMNFIIFFVLNSQFRMAVLRLIRWRRAAGSVINGTDATLMDG